MIAFLGTRHKTGCFILIAPLVAVFLVSFSKFKENTKPDYLIIGCDTSIVYFKQQVLPILQTKCIMCHNPKNQKHGVILNNYENIIATIEVEDDDNSDKNELAKVIIRGKMPPYSHEKLTVQQKKTLLKWIQQGMPNNSCEEKLEIAKSNFTFDNTLKPVLENHCIGCHSGSNPANGFDFTNTNIAMEVVKSGKLLKTISHEAGVTPMPFMSDKISDAEIESVKQWIQNGMN